MDQTLGVAQPLHLLFVVRELCHGRATGEFTFYGQRYRDGFLCNPVIFCKKYTKIAREKHGTRNYKEKSTRPGALTSSGGHTHTPKDLPT